MAPSDELTGEVSHCNLCGETVGTRSEGNRHIKNDHSFLEVLKHDLWKRTPPIQHVD